MHRQTLLNERPDETPPPRTSWERCCPSGRSQVAGTVHGAVSGWLAGMLLAFWILVPLTLPGEAAGETARAEAAATVTLVELRGSINPGTAELLKRAIEEAEAQAAVCLVVELDTPGGLVSTLRDMVQAVMGAPVPVVVYVAPGGAQAASAGALLTLSAHVAAMAPGTNIGAAHPVNIGSGGGDDPTMKQKAENDLAAMARSVAAERGRNAEWAEKAVRESVSASASEALELGVIDLVARDTAELLTLLNGRNVEVRGKERGLATANPVVREVRESLRERILRTIADPNIAYILMMIGITGLYFELAHPGSIFPGTVGAISLLLGLFALQTLPVSTTGLLLLLLAVILFLLELVVPSHGILGAAGFGALLLGSLMLFDTSRTGVAIAGEVLWTTLLTVGGSLTAVVYLVTRATLSKPRSGAEGLVGEQGIVREKVDPNGGLVFVHGELWKAVSDEEIAPGAEVRVTGMHGFKLHVSRPEGGRK